VFVVLLSLDEEDFFLLVNDDEMGPVSLTSSAAIDLNSLVREIRSAELKLNSSLVLFSLSSSTLPHDVAMLLLRVVRLVFILCFFFSLLVVADLTRFTLLFCFSFVLLVVVELVLDLEDDLFATVIVTRTGVCGRRPVSLDKPCVSLDSCGDDLTMRMLSGFDSIAEIGILTDVAAVERLLFFLVKKVGVCCCCCC